MVTTPEVDAVVNDARGIAVNVIANGALNVNLLVPAVIAFVSSDKAIINVVEVSPAGPLNAPTLFQDEPSQTCRSPSIIYPSPLVLPDPGNNPVFARVPLIVIEVPSAPAGPITLPASTVELSVLVIIKFPSVTVAVDIPTPVSPCGPCTVESAPAGPAGPITLPASIVGLSVLVII